MSKLFYSFLPFIMLGCTIDRSMTVVSGEEERILDQFKALDPGSMLQITQDDEKGKKLTLCLTFVGKNSKEVLTNRKVHFYHTDSKGEYRPSDPSDETTARLNGSATTDAKGRIYVKTLLPGDYGSSSDNRHIHTTFFGAHPEAYDIHFKQYTGFMGKRFIRRSDQHFLADLKELDNNTLISFLTIEVKSPQGKAIQP